MKNRKFTGWKLAWLVIAFGCMGFTQTQAATLEATLIYASDDPASLDRRMDNIEFRLRKLFKFEHYQLLDQQRTLIGPKSEATVRFRDGYSLELTTGKGGEKGFPATLVWLKDGQKLMSTGIKIGKSKPAILGGPSYKNGNLILSIELK